MSGFSIRGKLTVTLNSCRALKSTELVGKMDPYVIVNITGNKDEKFKTKVVKGGHENPTFDQAYIFNLEGKEDLLHVNVWNSRTLGDDHVGRLDLSLDNLDLSGKPRWYQLKDRSNFTKVNGEISMTCIFEGQGLPSGTLAFTTHQAAKEAAEAASSPAVAPAPAAVSTPSPAPQVQTPPQQQPPQYASQPQQYGSQPQQYGSQPQQYQTPPQQQQQYGYPGQQYQSQTPVYQAPRQPQPQVVYAATQPAVVYQAAPQVVYAQPVVQQRPMVGYVQQPQIIGYWPNGQPRYAGQ